MVYYKYIVSSCQKNRRGIRMGYRIGFIGAGNMASAIIVSLPGNGYAKEDIYIYDIDEKKQAEFAAEGYHTVSGAADVVNFADIIFLAVRPAEMKSVITLIKPFITNRKVLVSVAAGVPIASVKKWAGKECKVIRVMPNIAMSVGCGAAALSYEMPITYNEFMAVRGIFELSGIVEVIPETRMNEIVAVNGSGAVYLYSLANSMIKGAVNQGIEPDIAKRLTFQTLLGATQMMITKDDDVDTLIRKVCSPNGTTAKIVDILEKRGIEQIISDSMLSCTKRAAELEREADLK